LTPVALAARCIVFCNYAPTGCLYGPAALVRCAFLDRNLHSRSAIECTPLLHLKLACV
jgi:hypothetical protein